MKKDRIIGFSILGVIIFGCMMFAIQDYQIDQSISSINKIDEKYQSLMDSMFPDVDRDYEINRDSLLHNIDKDFNLFFDLFSKDSIFQTSRIRFPLKRMTQEIEKDSPSIGWIKKEYWKFLKLENKVFDNYSIEIQENIDAAIIEIRGIENGIYVNFNFIKENDKWILILWEDYST